MKAKKHPGRGNKLVYPRIVWAARQLGVSRTHLTAVLNGEREGRAGLADEYKRLKAKGEGARQAMAEAAEKLAGSNPETHKTHEKGGRV